MHEIGCADLAKAGAWALADCCVHCHEGGCMDELALDMDAVPGRGSVRLLICCRAGVDLELSELDSLFPGLTGPSASP